jgi:hypothetical protein
METFPLDVAQETCRDVILQKGITLQSRVETPAGAHRVRVVVHEVRTGAAVSVTAPLPGDGCAPSGNAR